MHSPEENKTPSLANWLLSKMIRYNLLEEFLGDLSELYEQRVQTRGKFYAWLMYWVDTLHLLIGFSFRYKKQTSNPMLLKNMFKIAWRNTVRQKKFTTLNVLGLTIGVATCIIVGLYVEEELTYDNFHNNGNRIYRINQSAIWGNWEDQFASTGPNVAVALKNDAHEFEQVTRILNLGEQTVNASGSGDQFNPVTERKFYAADPNFFEVFSFKFLKGDPKTSLTEPMSMVLTEATAKRYFDSENPIGKSVLVKKRDGSWSNYSVTGVLEDIPHKSHLQFDMLVSLTSYNEMMREEEWKWIFTAFSTYGLVREGVNIQHLTQKIQAIPPKWAAPTTERIFKQSYTGFTRGKDWKLYLQPLRQIYISGMPAGHRFGPTGNPKMVKIFSAVGILVLILCCINFMNLSTARSSNRAKEVGIRKVLGSSKGKLINQFVFESVFFVAISTVCALLIVLLSLNSFNFIAGKQLDLLSHFRDPFFPGILVLFVLALGVLTGCYPAFYLSSFQPIETLKGKLSAGFKGKSIRNSLVVFQFAISIALIICTVFVQKQLSYTSSLDIGFVKSNILQIHKMEQLGLSAEALKTKLKSNPAFTHVGKSCDVPPNVWNGERYRPFGTEKTTVDISHLRAEKDYLDLLGVEFIAGRNFDPGRVNDKYGVILNEEAVKVLGWGIRDHYESDSPVGKFVIQAFDKEEKLEVIGVVRNFNFNSVRQKIEPLMIIHPENDLFWNYGLGPSFLSVRLNPVVVKNPEKLRLLLEDIKKEIALIDKSVPFEYSFMDQDFENTFRSESRMSAILNIFTLVALIVACLGLFGLSAFSAEQRTRELSIRKVLGARVIHLAFLFSSEFAKLILIAVMIASPIAYLVVDSWLNDFAYRTPIEAGVFSKAILGALAIALATISYQSFRIANVNPVKTLKNE